MPSARFWIIRRPLDPLNIRLAQAAERPLMQISPFPCLHKARGGFRSEIQDRTAIRGRSPLPRAIKFSLSPFVTGVMLGLPGLLIDTTLVWSKE